MTNSLRQYFLKKVSSLRNFLFPNRLENYAYIPKNNIRGLHYIPHDMYISHNYGFVSKTKVQKYSTIPLIWNWYAQ